MLRKIKHKNENKSLLNGQINVINIDMFKMVYLIHVFNWLNRAIK